MIPSKIREMPNPYFPITSQLSASEFIGRENEISKFSSILEDYPKTLNLKNVIITGEKSIGKSTLLHRLKQKLHDYKFIVYEVELIRDISIDIDEFEFFKDLINELFVKYAPPEGAYFDPQQSEIWFSLTTGKYEHKSDFINRKIGFATQYANRKRGINEKLSYKSLEKDFEAIIDQLVSTEMEAEGFAILIDEFQELSRNVLVLDILRQLSEKLAGLMVVGAGLPTFLDIPSFEKFSRVSVPINLKSMERNDILDLIFKPIERTGPYSRHEVKYWFHPESVYDIVTRSGGNPLHVKILCAKMFDHFQNNPSLQNIELNKIVMEEVMQYYSSISEKSRRIRLSLESCSRQQLDAFNLLYRYGGFSIRAAILLELAFGQILPEAEEAIKTKIFEAFKDIWDLGLFEFKQSDIHHLKDIIDLSTNSLSLIEYKFIGDSIDKLYASYYFEELTGERLAHYSGEAFEDVLALKLSKYFNNILTSKNIPPSAIIREDPLVRLNPSAAPEETDGKNILTELDKLIKIKDDDVIDLKKKEEVWQISKKYALDFPAHIASMLEFAGYYFIIADLNIKGKRKQIYTYYPVISKDDTILVIREQIKDLSILNCPLDQYMIKINFIYIYWLPIQMLLLITKMDVGNEIDTLFKMVSRREFDDAVEKAHIIQTLSSKLRPQSISYRVEYCNNYGFCLINVNSLGRAEKELTLCQDKFLIARVNLAYLKYLQNDLPESRKILAKIIRKHLGSDEETRFLHLAVNHSKLPMANRIVENVLLYHVALWNWSLISTQEDAEQGMVTSVLKKVKPRGDELLLHRRVLSWVHYYRGEKRFALEQARKLLLDSKEIQYLHDDLKKDIQIFESEITIDI